MIEPVVILERLSLVSPFGVRFWDAVTNTFIAAGLEVETYPLTNPMARIKGSTNSSNVVIFSKLPGLDQAGAGDDDYWAAVERKEYVVTVRDTLGRFQPFSFEAVLPARGLYQLGCLPVESPPGSPPGAELVGVPLYSTAARQYPAGTAVMHADLVDADTGAPAAWAVLEVRMSGRLLARGLADAGGRIVLIFHYPEPLQLTGSSPPSTVRMSLSMQTWSVELHAFYTPSMLGTDIPDLCRVLNQPPATVWDHMSPPVPLTHVTVRFGADLVLRSGTDSALLISPTG